MFEQATGYTDSYQWKFYWVLIAECKEIGRGVRGIEEAKERVERACGKGDTIVI